MLEREDSCSNTETLKYLISDSVLGIPRSSECSRGSGGPTPTNQKLQTLFVVGIMRRSTSWKRQEGPGSEEPYWIGELPFS